MAEIKSLSAIKEKWTRVTPGRSEDYKLGVLHPKRDWETETVNAKDNYKAGVDKAHALDLFAKGAAKAGTQKWQNRSTKKGPGRFAEGVYMSGDDYAKGYEPYRAAIEAVDLGAKFPRRDPRNLDRVRKVVEAVVARKVA